MNCEEYGVNTTVSELSGFIGNFVDDGGCSTGGSPRGGFVWLLAALAVLIRRRR
ncbi:MAG: hypothetical protein KJO07_18925 [Deltaproteobacteria bacterium]|nr:hypothetical protein [Deltaproteobacteria bacterium]